MDEELKVFNIDINDIKQNDELFDNIRKAVDKLRLETLKDRFEVVLNNNLIESKEKITNFRTIIGCRISYADLDRNISFIVREYVEPSYEKLQQENKQLKEQLDKAICFINEYIREDYYDELEEYITHFTWNTTKEDLLEILKGENNE